MEQFSFSRLLVELIKNPQSTLVIFCAVLLAALMGWIPSPLTQSLNVLEKTVTVLEKHDQSTREANVARAYATRYQNMLLRSICRNEAPLKEQGQCEPKYDGFQEK